MKRPQDPFEATDFGESPNYVKISPLSKTQLKGM